MTQLAGSSSDVNRACVQQFLEFIRMSWVIIVFNCHQIVVSRLEDLFVRCVMREAKPEKVQILESDPPFVLESRCDRA